MKAVSGDVPELPSLDGELVGILAGWGRLRMPSASWSTDAGRAMGGMCAVVDGK